MFPDRKFPIRWVQDTASNFIKYFGEEDCRPNIIEMVGLLDYFDDSKVESIFKIIKENLSDGGVFITANVCHNKEVKFVTNLVDWRMKYRDAEQMVKLAISAGFDKDKITAYYEPLKVHTVLVIKK